VGGPSWNRSLDNAQRRDGDAKSRLSVTDASLVCGVLGTALLREWYLSSPDRTIRLQEMCKALDLYDEEVLDMPAVEVTLEDGYTEWAATYDGQNPMVELERSVVHPILEHWVVPGTVVLDAGCGTGRHAAFALDLGGTVMGIDLSAPMLDVARSRRELQALIRASVDALPVSSASVDVIVCGLALCHLKDLTPALREFRRVVRSGGRVVISDPHSRSRYIGGQGFYAVDEAGRRRFVRNEHRDASEWISHAIECGFSITGCHEPRVQPDAFSHHPVSEFFTGAAPAAFGDAPELWVWEMCA